MCVTEQSRHYWSVVLITTLSESVGKHLLSQISLKGMQEGTIYSLYLIRGNSNRRLQINSVSAEANLVLLVGSISVLITALSEINPKGMQEDTRGDYEEQT